MERKKILVVDDEFGFTEMVKLNLEATGYFTVIIENSGSNAFNSTLQHKPDLILLDVIMPDLEGPDVVNQLRSHDQTKDIPIVFFTATVTKEEVEAQSGYIAGHAFLAKPGTLGELLNCIERQLAVA